MLQYECDESKTLKGRPDIICEDDGHFTNFEFECAEKCDPLPKVDLAVPVLDLDLEYAVGDLVTYKCTNRYQR